MILCKGKPTALRHQNKSSLLALRRNPSPCALREPSLSHASEERDKRPNALPFSPLAWEKGLGDEGKTEMH
jgi:hypothetical protein